MIKFIVLILACMSLSAAAGFYYGDKLQKKKSLQHQVAIYALNARLLNEIVDDILQADEDSQAAFDILIDDTLTVYFDLQKCSMSDNSEWWDEIETFMNNAELLARSVHPYYCKEVGSKSCAKSNLMSREFVSLSCSDYQEIYSH